MILCPPHRQYRNPPSILLTRIERYLKYLLPKESHKHVASLIPSTFVSWSKMRIMDGGDSIRTSHSQSRPGFDRDRSAIRVSVLVHIDQRLISYSMNTVCRAPMACRKLKLAMAHWNIYLKSHSTTIPSWTTTQVQPVFLRALHLSTPNAKTLPIGLFSTPKLTRRLSPIWKTSRVRLGGLQ